MISETKKKNVCKNIIYIILFLLTAYACQTAGSLITLCISSVNAGNSGLPKGTSLFLTYLLYVIVFGAFSIKTGILHSDAGFPDKAKLLHYIYIIIAGISLQYLVTAILTYITMTNPDMMRSYNNMVNTSFSKSNGILTILAVSILAPTGEELLFRGLIQNYTNRITEPILSIIINGLLFGLYHMNPVQMCYALPVGILLAYITYVSNTVYPAILLHMAVNITSMFIPSSLFAKKETIIITAMVSSVIAILCIIRYVTTYRDK